MGRHQGVPAAEGVTENVGKSLYRDFCGKEQAKRGGQVSDWLARTVSAGSLAAPNWTSPGQYLALLRLGQGHPAPCEIKAAAGLWALNW